MMAHELPISIHSENPPYDGMKQSVSELSKSNSKKKSKSGSNTSSASTSSKSKNQSQQQRVNTPPVRLLPNGVPVDFGNGTTPLSKKNGKKQLNQNSRASTPSLPDGSAPNFNPGATNFDLSNKNNKKFNDKSKQTSEQCLPNGSKPNFRPNNGNGNGNVNNNNNNNNNNTSEKSKKNSKLASKIKNQLIGDTYAGSSFHSSPEALNLPKPSFKSTSPKTDQAIGGGGVNTSPLQVGRTSPAGQVNGVVQQPTALQQYPPIRAGPHPNLTYPVTLYRGPAFNPAIPVPVTHPVIYSRNQFVQNGFSYQHTPLGNISYQNAPGGPFPPQFAQHPHSQPPQFAQGQYSVPVPQPIQQLQQQPPQQLQQPISDFGQKLTFNELVGSAQK